MARLLIDQRFKKGKFIISIMSWEVPKSTNIPSGIKIRLSLIKNEERILGYDNNLNEALHKHLFDKKISIKEIELTELVEKFRKECFELMGVKENVKNKRN